MKYTFPQRMYLDAIVALNYPEQAPAYIAATWWHFLWILVPIAGIVAFPESVEQSYRNKSNEFRKAHEAMLNEWSRKQYSNASR